MRFILLTLFFINAILLLLNIDAIAQNKKITQLPVKIHSFFGNDTLTLKYNSTVYYTYNKYGSIIKKISVDTVNNKYKNTTIYQYDTLNREIYFATYDSLTNDTSNSGNFYYYKDSTVQIAGTIKMVFYDSSGYDIGYKMYFKSIGVFQLTRIIRNYHLFKEGEVKVGISLTMDENRKILGGYKTVVPGARTNVRSDYMGIGLNPYSFKWTDTTYHHTKTTDIHGSYYDTVFNRNLIVQSLQIVTNNENGSISSISKEKIGDSLKTTSTTIRKYNSQHLAYESLSYSPTSASKTLMYYSVPNVQSTTEQEKHSFYTIYPVPAHDRIFINASQEGPISFVYLKNTLGNVVAEEQNYNNGIEISQLTPGFYFLEFMAGGEKVVKPLVIE